MLSGFLGDGIGCMLLLAKVNRQPILGQGELFKSQQHKIQTHHFVHKQAEEFKIKIKCRSVEILKTEKNRRQIHHLVHV